MRNFLAGVITPKQIWLRFGAFPDTSSFPMRFHLFTHRSPLLLLPVGPHLFTGPWPLLADYATASSRGFGEPGTGAEMPNTIRAVPTY